MTHQTKPPMPSNIKKTILLLTLLTMVCIAFGCVSRRAAEIPTRFYTFEYEPPVVQKKPLLDFSVKIDRFCSSPFYESNRIVFKERPGNIDSYFYHRWWTRPANLVTYFLLRDMRNTELFRAVLPFDTNMPYTHIIEGYLEKIYEKDYPDKWYAVLNVNMTLVAADKKNPMEKLLFQKRYSQTEPCLSKTPSALAAAMSKAMSRLSESIIVDVYDQISR